MIKRADSQIRHALNSIALPDELTVASLFTAVQALYPRPLELLRGEPPVEGLRANGLWLTRPDANSDTIWIAPELTGAAAVHSLAHEIGHFLLGHEPVVLHKPKSAPEPEEFQFLSASFLDGCLIGRTRSQDGPQDPEYQRIENEAERFAFLLRRTADQQARDTQYGADPLLDRLHHSL
ncbi:ImmA/IrrE family metallo-endopeptidase [Streptomyces lunaelactis]|uniref:ImmA/IrrE family metallo-endopeptidase n=1 Tax=Streptomyces lunaelactis TaxID=1535768 RepID=UPI0015845174|nr:ImmA/IrrE family metallo-endopeptidase [Streptomyces lunaelactis]NUL25962.1 ImmA/IrrE family metallo-endopeptidase [Streptomyces lunaelactis]